MSDRYRRYEAALLSFDRRTCSRLVHEQVEDPGSIPRVYEQLLKPALYRVGELWERNEISVAAEHVTTGITEGVMNELYPHLLGGERLARSVVIAAVEGELHQVGAKMVADAFELHGWDATFVGASTPIPELVRIVREREPDVVGLSLSIYFHIPALEAELRALRDAGFRRPILVGGQAFTHGGEGLLARHPGVFLARDLHDVRTFIERHTQESP
jgi:methanogenic corrinoid protein MtbC1